MNITTKGRYALRLMTDIAMNDGSGPVSLAEVAERQALSLKYIESIAAHLKKAGIITSVRGKSGGYMLSRPPAECTVGEILRSTEGGLEPVSCLRDGCDRSAECLALPMWRELDELATNYFDSVTLRDLLTGERWSAK